jgi:hypothetical protein
MENFPLVSIKPDDPVDGVVHTVDAETLMNSAPLGVIPAS